MTAPWWFRIGAYALRTLAVIAALFAMTALVIFAMASMFAVLAAVLNVLPLGIRVDGWFIGLWWLWLGIWCIGIGVFLDLKERHDW